MIGRIITYSQSVGIRWKMMGLAVAAVLSMGVPAAILAQSALLSFGGAELDRRGASIAADIVARSTDLLLTHNALAMMELLADTMKNNEDVRYVAILDAKNQAVAHTFPGSFPPDLLRVESPADNERQRSDHLETNEGQIHDVAVPIVVGWRVGTVRVGMSPQRLKRQAMLQAENMILIMMGVAAMAILGAFMLTHLLTYPVFGLVEVARRAAGGDLSARTPTGPADEIGLLNSAFNDMLAQLQQAQQIRNELLDRVISAQEEERRRIARELHDETSQAITSLIVGLRIMEDAHPEVRERSERLRLLAASTLDEIHDLILELRPRALDELGLQPALRRYVKDFGQKHGIRVDFQAMGIDQRLPPRVETCLYRIVQEALTNVARHSGARTASVVVDTRSSTASAVIEDDGNGFDPEKAAGHRSLGLAGMRERAALLQGKIQIESSPGLGTSVFVKIPVGEA